MTNEDILDEIRQAIKTGAEIGRKSLPYKTGNLSINAYKYYEEDDGDDVIFHVYIDNSIAPYADYINKPGYKTSGYWESTKNLLINYLNSTLGGK